MRSFVAFLIVIFSTITFGEELSTEDFRVFCGYVEEVDKPEMKTLDPAKRDQRIAKMAKLPIAKLQAHLTRARAFGNTCDSVKSTFEGRLKNALQKANFSYETLEVDIADPAHVVASLIWRRKSPGRQCEEAATAASLLAESLPFVKTFALQVRDLGDPSAQTEPLFEGKLSLERAKQIERSQIDKFAETRYAKLFDGVKGTCTNKQTLPPS